MEAKLCSNQEEKRDLVKLYSVRTLKDNQELDGERLASGDQQIQDLCEELNEIKETQRHLQLVTIAIDTWTRSLRDDITE
jgi:hypothetical protein